MYYSSRLFNHRQFFFCYLFFISFLFFLIPFLSLSQLNCGLPYIHNYSAAEYGAGTDNWAVVQDKRGVMYFANFSGVLEYDGSQWRTIQVSNQSLVRSLAVDSNGIIFVGAVGEFGYLSPGKRGELVYHSLIDKLPPEYGGFADVWKIYASPSGVFFQTYDYLFLYTDNGIKVLTPSNSFHFSFYVNDRFYITDRGKGLMMFRDDSLVLTPGGEFFADKRIYAMLPYRQDTAIVATREEGMFLFTLNNSESSGKKIQPFISEADEYHRQYQTYHGILLKDDMYAFATRLGGVMIFDKTGRIKRIINKKSLLQNENVRFVFSDAEEGLWMALDDGIARAEISSPINFFSEISGLKGSVSDVLKFGNTIYSTTTQGIFYMNSGNTGNKSGCFSSVQQISSQSWDLLEIKNNAEGKNILLAATTDGVYNIEQNNAVLINDAYSFKLHRSKKNPNRIFVGSYDGLLSLLFENDHWINEGMAKGTGSEIRSISEDKHGNIFLGMPYLGVAALRFCDDCKNEKDSVYETSWREKYVIDKFDTSKGLPDLVWNTVFESSEEILVGTFKGLYLFDNSKKEFVPEYRFGKHFANGSRQVFSFVQNDGNTWIYTANSRARELSLIREEEIILKPFRRFYEHEIQTVYLQDSSQLWLGGANGLIDYDLQYRKNFDSPFQSLIRKVVAGKDSLIFSGTNFSILSLEDSVLAVPSFSQPDEIIFSLPFSFNSIAFEFSAATFDNEASNHFRWFLEGYDSEWSPWSKEHKTHYTNLREGRYKFHLKSNNIYETEGSEAIYEFVILPPWYRTIPAYLSYLLLLIGLIYASVKISVRRLEQAKIRLENIVTERTAEVVKQKEKIESQHHQLEHKTKEITDSINYARRIQEAILPSESYLNKMFSAEPDLNGDYFVLFKPKDIVSGDFYWAFGEGAGIIIWAAVDCTGHGVPGAFMSMIGNSLLNEIVVENKINNSDEILNHLREAIIKSLKQTGEVGRQKDGMDISLCVLDKNSNIMQFSGANNPLWIVRAEGGEIQAFKPDKQPIGYYSEQMKPFTRQEIQLQKGDLIYTFTDGYEDQFGGPKKKKFMAKQMRELLLSIRTKSMKEQKEILDSCIVEWMGEEEQIDDICVIGVKI